jgi:hypothetical protein
MQVVGTWSVGQADALRQALHMTNESYAEYLGVAVRTVAYWCKKPEIIPQPAIQETLDTALERASDRAKARFDQLMGTITGPIAAWHGPALAGRESQREGGRVAPVTRSS